MRNILSKRVLYSIELSAFIMVCLLVAIWYNIRVASSKEQWVNHTDEVMIHIGRMQYAASESSIFARNFMLTGETNSITLFNNAVDVTLKELDDIRVLTADNPIEKPLLDSSTRYLIKRIDFSKQVIETRKTKGEKAAIQLVQSGYGRAYIDKANYYIQRIGDNESRLLQSRKDESKRANLILNICLLITLTFVLALLLGMLRKSGKEVLRNKRLIKELTKKEERNKQAEQLAAMGTWNMNMQTLAVTGSDEMYRIWGIDENKKGDFADDFIKRVHPDDQAFIRKKMQELPMQNEDNYNFRLLVNGDVKYISTGITVNRGDNDEIINITGYAQDVTQETVIALKLETANEELKVLFNKIGEVHFSRDMVANCFIQISDTCQQLTGYTIEEFKTNDQLWVIIIHPDDRHVVHSGNARLEQGQQIVTQYRIIRKDGELRWVENKIIPTMNTQGTVLLRIDAVLRDINEKKIAEIEREKIMDELLKRNAALEEYTYIVSHNLRKPVANIMGLTQLLEMGDIDVDNQKNIVERLHSSVDTLDGIVKDINDVLQDHICDKKQTTK